jgi:YD repeat-containing protein
MLASLQQDLAGSAEDVTFNLSYLPGNQASSLLVSNTAYAYAEPADLDHAYSANRLNQIERVDVGSYTFRLSYDANGNLTGDGTHWSYVYDVENRLTGASGPAVDVNFGYDPLGRRAAKTVTGAASNDQRFLYGGAEVIADTDAAGTILRHYVYGPGADACCRCVNHFARRAARMVVPRSAGALMRAESSKAIA